MAACRSSREEVTASIVDSLVPAVVFLVSIPLAYWVSAVAGRLFWFSLVPIGYFVHRVVGRSDA